MLIYKGEQTELMQGDLVLHWRSQNYVQILRPDPSNPVGATYVQSTPSSEDATRGSCIIELAEDFSSVSDQDERRLRLIEILGSFMGTNLVLTLEQEQYGYDIFKLRATKKEGEDGPNEIPVDA
jgi:hypothetical protein